MDKPRLKSYLDGVAHEIDPEQFGSLNQLLEDSFKKNAAKPFSVCMDRWMSYAQLDELSSALGVWLKKPGPRARRTGRHHAAQLAPVHRHHGCRFAGRM